jgi:GNAT superfamily N-acetyltransferase
MDSTLGEKIATLSDLETVTTTIALAFRNDPIWGPAFASADGSDKVAMDLWRVCVEGALRYPWTWLVGSGEAVSVWFPPGAIEMSSVQEERFERLAREHLGPACDPLFELFGLFGASHPHDVPHYYLSLLGTHPDHCGRGLGMALLAQNLTRVDAEAMPVFLESSNPANNHRYESLGFSAIGSFTVPNGDSVVTGMWRPAAEKGGRRSGGHGQ